MSRLLEQLCRQISLAERRKNEDDALSRVLRHGGKPAGHVCRGTGRVADHQTFLSDESLRHGHSIIALAQRDFIEVTAVTDIWRNEVGADALDLVAVSVLAATDDRCLFRRYSDHMHVWLDGLEEA